EEDVVDQGDDLVVDREVERRFVDDRRVADARQVVAIERDVDGAERHGDALVLADGLAQPRRQDVTTRADADDAGRPEIAVALDDLMSDTGDRTTDVVGAEQDGAWRCHSLIPFPASQDRSLKVMRCQKYTSV